MGCIDPSRPTGRTFAGFLRIAQCVSAGVPVVVERGDNPSDPLEALTSRLGGVHFVGYDDLVPKVVEVYGGGQGVTGLTGAQACGWAALSARLQAWNGTKAGLAALLALDPLEELARAGDAT